MKKIVIQVLEFMKTKKKKYMKKKLSLIKMN